MAEPKLWHLVAYDVRDPSRLRRTAKHLLGYGFRLQYSIFKCRLTERQAERLKWELTQILAEEDSLLMLGLCERCESKLLEKNINDETCNEGTTYEII